MPDLPGILSAVQKNCDISDARHAGDYTLCTYLLKMREYYRWEHDLSYFVPVPQDDLGTWLTAREQMWNELETLPMTPVPMGSGLADPFDSESINRELVPSGYVYSAGYGRFNKPLVFPRKSVKTRGTGRIHDSLFFMRICTRTRGPAGHALRAHDLCAPGIRAPFCMGKN